MGKSITDLSSVTRVGLDLAKHVFQVHGVDAAGEVVFNKAIKRDKLLAFFAALPQCLVGVTVTVHLTDFGIKCTGLPPISETR
jgi:transposase